MLLQRADGGRCCWLSASPPCCCWGVGSGTNAQRCETAPRGRCRVCSTPARLPGQAGGAHGQTGAPVPRRLTGGHEQIHMVVNIWGSAWTSARRDGTVGRAAAREACPNLNYRLPSAEQRLGFFRKVRLGCRVDFAVQDLGAAARAAAFTSSPGVFCASGDRRSAAAEAR